MDIGSGVIYSFQVRLPLDAKPHTLVLGTMASIESLQRGESYGHPHNAFWHIIGRRFGFERATTPYEDQVARLTGQGFALWDVLHSCEREGSLDSNIKNEKPNDIAALLARCTSIRRVCLNGQGAAGFFRKHIMTGEVLQLYEWTLVNDSARKVFGRHVASSSSSTSVAGRRAIELAVLPSTSPAYATLRFEQKLEQWTRDCFSLQ